MSTADTSPTNVARYPTLHRYFLHASRNRNLFMVEIQGAHPFGPQARLHLELWYACLVPVLEGWKAEAINDPTVTALMRDRKKVELLKRCRNAVFHYSPDYLDPRVEALMIEAGFVNWVHRLHEAISDFFLGVG